MDGMLLFALGWGLGLLALFLLSPRFVRRWGKNFTVRQAILLLVGVALLVRLVPNVVLSVGGGYDIESYQVVSDVLLSGEDVYTHPDSMDRHPYLPFQMYWMALSRWLSGVMAIPFLKIVRLAPVGADAIITLVLFFYLCRSVSLEAGLQGGLAYALNPIPVFVSAYHGQFDAIPTLFLLLSTVTVERSALEAGGWIGLGILNKSWPVLGSPSLWVAAKGWRQRIKLVGAAVLVPLVGIALYLWLVDGDLGSMLGKALGYNWGVGVWGYTYFIKLFSVLTDNDALFLGVYTYGRYLTLVVLGGIWLVYACKRPVVEGVFLVLLTFFAATHAFSIQYLLWLIPFAILNKEWKWLARYTLAGLSYYSLTYPLLIMSTRITDILPWPQADYFLIQPSELPAWFVTVAWLIAFLHRGRDLEGEKGISTGVEHA